jgi:hypothetical protein
MAIYRGPGGPGDAIADADSEAALISTLVTQAETAASNASTSATNASNSATSASNSATSASNSASAASSSASNASTSASNAASSASAASSSASAASTSATNAATSATAAANSFDSFDDRYLGAKASAPSVDNDGNALLTGALYFNSSSSEMFVWDGSQWDSITASGSGTVTSVAMTVPTGLSVSGSPITTTGTLAVTYSSGYAIPTTTKQSNWDDSYTFVSNFPTQTGNNGKYLTTNGSSLSWATVSYTETDPIVGAINGIVKANGSGTISAASAGTDYLAPAAIGVTVQAYDADTAKLDVAQSFTAQQTFKEVKDTVHTITDGAAFEIDPANGSIQVVTLGASRTPAATNFEAGQVVLLGIDDGTAYTITWTTVNPTWVKAGGTASAPTLATTGYTWILLWKVSSTIYATEVGKP